MITQSQKEEMSKRFDEKFKCIQGDCDGTGHIPEQLAEDEWTSSQCQFHAEYIFPIKNFLQSEIDLAISAELKEIREEIEKEKSKIIEGTTLFGDGEISAMNLIINNLSNRIK